MTESYRLFLLQPKVVFAAQVNQSEFPYPISAVAYDNVTEGSYTDIEVGQTVFFGTTPGDYNLGAQRVRALPTGDTLYIGRSSRGRRPGEVDLDDDVYITVLDLREVWARPPYIAEDGTISKDPGLPVEWRTTTPPPVANTGPGFCGTIDPDTGVIAVALPPSAPTSFATADGATITDYLWDVKDGTIVTGDATSDTIVATFPAGFRYVSLTVTDSEGHSHTAYCPIFARDPADDETIPFQFVGEHSITPDGQRLSVRPLVDIPATIYPPGTLAMIWRNEPEDLFDRNHMVIIGWLGDIPADISAQRTGTLRDVTLEILDVAGRLDRLPGFSQRVEDDSLRNTTQFPEITWYHMVDLNMDKYLHYLLAWHSTALSLADFEWSGTGNTYAATGLESGGDTLWEQVASQAAKMRPDWRLTCNRRGQLRVLPDPMLLDVGERTAAVPVVLYEPDWSDIRYDHRRHPRVYWLRSGAVLAGTSVPISVVFSVAPGDAPGQGGQEQTHNEGLVESQDALNACEGHRYARLNAAQSYFRITLADGNDRDIEPADMTWVELTLPAELAAQRGYHFTERRGLVHEIHIRYTHAREGLTKTVELVWEGETSGTPAVTYIPPQSETVPGDDVTWPGDYWGEPPPPVEPPEPYVPPMEILQTWTFVEPEGTPQGTGFVGVTLELDTPTEQWDVFALAYVYHAITGDVAETVTMASGGGNPTLFLALSSVGGIASIGGDMTNRSIGVRAYQAVNAHTPDSEVHVRWPADMDTVLGLHVIHLRGAKHSNTSGGGSGMGSAGGDAGSQGYGDEVKCEPELVIDDEVKAVLEAGIAPLRVVPKGSFILYAHAEGTTEECVETGTRSATFERIVVASAQDWEIGYWGPEEFLGFAQEEGPWELPVADSLTAGCISAIAALSIAPEVPVED